MHITLTTYAWGEAPETTLNVPVTGLIFIGDGGGSRVIYGTRSENVKESPSEIAALIQAARDEEWRRQLVCAALPALIETIGERAPGWMEDCAVKAWILASLTVAEHNSKTVAAYNLQQEKERRHADKG